METNMSAETLPRRAYRLDEVAAILGLARNTVRGLVAEGRLKTVRVGRAVLVLSDDLDAFIEGLRKP
jgi:excisionase family DNA binding protein